MTFSFPIRYGKDTTQYKHGGNGTRLYHTWVQMKQRCYNKNNVGYLYCGVHGISVCEEWKDDFVAFRDWSLLHGYTNNLTIDRINNKDNYTPNNCQWIMGSENAGKDKPKKPVNQYDLDGDLLNTYISIREAERETGVGNQNIGKVCQYKRKSAGGYLWRYS